MRDVTAAYSAIELESDEIGLGVNKSKTHCMLSIIGGMRRIGSQITADNRTFDVVNEFVYSDDDVSL